MQEAFKGIATVVSGRRALGWDKKKNNNKIKKKKRKKVRKKKKIQNLSDVRIRSDGVHSTRMAAGVCGEGARTTTINDSDTSAALYVSYVIQVVYSIQKQQM